MLTLKKNILYIIVFSIAILITIVSYYDQQKAMKVNNQDLLGGDFSIPIAETTTNENTIFHLADYKGKVVVLYFGYASCPDVCPTALAMVGNALKKLSEKERSQIQPLFISVDPQRDTLDKLALYGQYFYPTMLAGTDSKENIDKLVRQYGAFYKISQQHDSAMGYTVDHTSTVYLIDKQGYLAESIGHADIQKNLASKVTSLINREN